MAHNTGRGAARRDLFGGAAEQELLYSRLAPDGSADDEIAVQVVGYLDDLDERLADDDHGLDAFCRALGHHPCKLVFAMGPQPLENVVARQQAGRCDTVDEGAVDDVQQRDLGTAAAPAQRRVERTQRTG
jgi:hypothetical protein